ncbi:MAG: hypothetical protein VW362_01360, partial [Candidatus Nanopelagicales bacterium]
DSVYKIFHKDRILANTNEGSSDGVLHSASDPAERPVRAHRLSAHVPSVRRCHARQWQSPSCGRAVVDFPGDDAEI